LLEEGREITTIWKLAFYSGDDDLEIYIAGTNFGETVLPDDSYAMVFEMWDIAGNYAYSDAFTFDCTNGETWITVCED